MRYPLHNSSGYNDRLPADTGRHLPSAVCRKGFTLIEMLITITILGILAAAVMGALQSARETAKAAKTKATITKLHYIIMARYDSYRTRRVPVDVREFVTAHSGAGDIYDANDSTKLHGTRAHAHARLVALRDLIRIEMPDRWSDVVLDHSSTTPQQEVPIAPSLLSNGFSSSISARYFRLYRDALTDTGGDIAKIGKNSSSECLYMIVMSIPEAAEQFQNSEIGDVDGDGLKEFIDGWGHPIKFIRWPVGFVDYERLNLLTPTSGTFSGQTGPAGSVGGPVLRWDSPSDLQSGNRQEQPDPFDSMGIGGGFSQWDGAAPGPGYTVFPLVYSAGPDGIYDINTGFGGTGTYVFTHLDYYEPDLNNGADDDGNTLRYIGQPRDADTADGTAKNNELNHYDNIHNHMLEVR